MTNAKGTQDDHLATRNSPSVLRPRPYSIESGKVIQQGEPSADGGQWDICGIHFECSL